MTMKEEMKVAIMEVSIDKSAKSMRDKAVAVNLAETKTIVNNLLKMIDAEADHGKMDAYLRVKGGRQPMAYENAQSILTSLGYTVSGDAKMGANDRQWLIRW